MKNRRKRYRPNGPRYKVKGYVRFDEWVLPQQVRKHVENPEWVTRHAFYPFLHFVMKTRRYRNGKKDLKPRKIYYSAHIDRYIYEKYAYDLNNAYERQVKIDGTHRCSIAYRSDLHKNNIDFAKEVFLFISQNKACGVFVVVGDFTEYFDSIDHKQLKDMILKLLCIERLPDDLYAVYKSVTKFAYIPLQCTT